MGLKNAVFLHGLKAKFQNFLGTKNLFTPTLDEFNFASIFSSYQR